jgi:replicative DNA helicase
MTLAKANAPKIPPQDLDAERSVLGALLLDKNAVIKVADFLTPGDFYHPGHRKIYECILDLFEKGQPIDILTVSHELKGKKTFKEIGGTDYLTELVASVPTSAHATEYANIVKEKCVRRDLIAASSEINENAMDQRNFDELIDSVEQRVFAISQRSRPQRFVHIREELPGAYERIERLHNGEQGGLRGVPTYFSELDRLISGLQPSDLIILGARPSFGKTAFALDVARQAALKGKSVGIFSLEMSRDQIIDRLISAQAQVPLWHLRTGQLKNDELEFSMIQQALDELSKASLYIDDTPSPNVLQLRSMARRLQIEGALDLIIIDYLQLIQPRTGSDNIVQQVTEISRGLKGLARELKVPVLALSQLSRAVDQREVKIPRLSDLRESGSLEQDADLVFFLYRKDRDRIDVPEDQQNIVDLIVAKHRNGPLGTVQFRFDAERVSFKQIDSRHMEEQ